MTFTGLITTLNEAWASSSLPSSCCNAWDGRPSVRMRNGGGGGCLPAAVDIGWLGAKKEAVDVDWPILEEEAG